MGRDEKPALSNVEKYQREINKILGEIALRRGKDAERKVLASIDEANGSKPEWLFGGRKAKREEDARGIDVFVLTDEGEIPLQVKSSENSRHNFRKYRKWHGIPCVVVEPHTHREEVFELVLKAISPTREKRLSKKKP